VMEIHTAKEAERAVGSLLFWAAAEGSLDKVEALLVAGVDPNFRDYEQRCPLHIAAGSGKGVRMIQLLLDHAADVNVVDMWGETPLHQSQRCGHARVERLLKENGAKLQKVRLQKKALREKWDIKRSEVLLGPELICTFKSAVHRATWNGIDVVAKIALLDCPDSTTEEIEEEMLHEIEILSTVRHPDLVMFLGCCIQESPIMFISQFMPGGDLEHYYESNRKEGAPWVAGKKVINRWSCSILRALNFLHSCAQPIIHRDLKPLNILLTDRLDVKVTDFGISKATHRRQFNSPGTSSMSSQETSPMSSCDPYSMTGGVGTWVYMAPEVARHQAYTEKVDIYAFALILYFMSSGRQPFHEFASPTAVLNEYSKGNEPRPQVSQCHARFRPIIVAAWDSRPEKRPSAGDLVERLVERHSDGCSCASM